MYPYLHPFSRLARRFGDERACMSMGWRRGGRGFGRFGGWPDDLGDGQPLRSGRKLGSGDLRLILLALLADRPWHGYELIKALEERSGGFYSPSPGMVYPALTYLEEVGHASVTQEGSRKLYTITEAGREELTARRQEADAMLEQLDRIAQGMSRMRETYRQGETERNFWERAAVLREARHELRSAIRSRFGSSPAEFERIAAVLRQAAADIRQVQTPPPADAD